MNELSRELYTLFASAFSYPNEEVRANIDRLHQALKENFSDSAETGAIFFEFVKTSPLLHWEEIYTRTFDVLAITTLDIGYVLFGDDYKRGELLANLNREHREAGNNCGSELSDNLTNILSLLPKMQDAEIRKDLVNELLLPALEKIIKDFHADTVELKNKVYKRQFKTIIAQSKDYARIYQHLLLLLYTVLEKDFEYQQRESEVTPNSFLKSINTEMEID